MIGLFSDPLIQNVVFEDNYTGWGGAVYLEKTDGDFINVQFTNNEGEIAGGIFCADGSNPRIINSTFSDNQALMGGSIVCLNNSNPVVINSIMWNPDANEEVFFSPDFAANSISISHSDIRGGLEGIITNDNGSVNWLDGNLDKDPLFMNSGNFPFALSNESPAVNKGDNDTSGLHLPETDLRGGFRIYGGRIDIGAYENQDIHVGIGDNNNLESEPGLQVFPNPFEGILNLHYNMKTVSEVRICIIDQMGKIVFHENLGWQKGMQRQTINTKELTNGIYQCAIMAGGTILTAKVVKVF
jgi:hypothetical protein